MPRLLSPAHPHARGELFVEHDDRRCGPFGPIGGPIPLHRYRSFKKTKTEERHDRIDELAAKLRLPRAVVDGGGASDQDRAVLELPVVPFKDPDPFNELRFPTKLAAKLAIADYLATPLARLRPEDRAYIDSVLAETLERRTIIECVRGYFHEKGRNSPKEEDDAV
jgi:hypothetical protein